MSIYKNLCWCPLGKARQKLRALIYGTVEMKRFIVISLLKQTLFLVALIDIETKLFLDRSDMQW